MNAMSRQVFKSAKASEQLFFLIGVTIFEYCKVFSLNSSKVSLSPSGIVSLFHVSTQYSLPPLLCIPKQMSSADEPKCDPISRTLLFCGRFLAVL
ncbi:protein of unknown function [Cyanobium sp. NIES-981]|nr:protein of unknown function [Cyanobium sp. NIES-981]